MKIGDFIIAKIIQFKNIGFVIQNEREIKKRCKPSNSRETEMEKGLRDLM